MLDQLTTYQKLLLLVKLKGSGGGGTLKTLTGNLPLTVSDALNHAIVSLTRYGLCTQDGTPTPDAPVDIVTNNGAIKVSQNLANMVSDNIVVWQYIDNSGTARYDSANFFYSPLIPVDATKTYTMHTSASLAYFSVMEYDSSQGFLKRDLFGTSSVAAGDTITFTVSADCAFIRFGSNMRKNTISLADVLAVDWMLTQTATAQDYRPYGEIYAGGTPEVLTVSGANLANMVAENIDVGKIIYETGTVANSAVNFVYNKYIPVEAGQNYVLYGRRKSDNAISAYNRICWYTANKGWISRATYTKDTIGSAVAPNNAAYARFTVAPVDNSDTLTLDDVLDFNWTFAKATEEIPYQPYVQPQTVGWKNLFDASSYTEINAYVNANTGVLTAGSPLSNTQYCAVIPCKPNTQYNITGQGTSAWGAFTSSSIGTTATAFTKGGNLTTGANDRYLIGLVRANGDSIDYRNTLIVRETVTDIPMLLGVGDYKDEVELVNGPLTHKVGVYVFTGQETVNKGQNVFTVDNLLNFPTNSFTPFCTRYEAILSTSSPATDSNKMRMYVTQAQVRRIGFSAVRADYETGADLAAEWARWYSEGNPMILVYPLATETTEQTTAQHLVTHKGVNVVESTANVSPVEVELQYYGTASASLLGDTQNSQQDTEEA